MNEMGDRKRLNEMTRGGAGVQIPPSMYGEASFPSGLPQGTEALRTFGDLQRNYGQPNVMSQNMLRRSAQQDAGMTPNPLRRSNQVAVPAEFDASKMRARNLTLEQLYKFMSGGQ
mgnify:CR=1 FL=1